MFKESCARSRRSAQGAIVVDGVSYRGGAVLMSTHSHPSSGESSTRPAATDTLHIKGKPTKLAAANICEWDCCVSADVCSEQINCILPLEVKLL